MVKAVLFEAEAQGGENRFPAGPLAHLSWFKSVMKGLGRAWTFRNSHGGAVVKAVVLEA